MIKCSFELNDQVHFMPTKAATKISGIESKWRTGIFVGLRERSEELLMMTENGVFRARSIKRKPEQERWDKEFLEKAVGTPWEPIPGRRKGEQTDLPGHVAVIPASEAGILEVQPAAEPRGAPRRVYIRKADLMRYGYTAGCKGCEQLDEAPRSGEDAPCLE